MMDCRRCSVRNESESVQVRHLIQVLGKEIQLGPVDLIKLITAGSELSRNMVVYGGGGEVLGEILEESGRLGLRLTFADKGPGIENLERALQDGYSSGGSLGIGLPGARRLVDDMDIETRVGEGTRVVVTKWKR